MVATYSDLEALKERISLSISRELLEAIDLMRGLIPRSALIEAILRWALSHQEFPDLYRLMNAYRRSS